MAIASETVLQKAREHSIRAIAATKLSTTNLHIDHEIRAANKPIGPEFQKIVAQHPTVVVFVDEAPLANFAHPCRYRLYHAESGEFLRDVAAQFPPFERMPPKTFQAFHQPIRFFTDHLSFPIKPILKCPIIFPDGARYAILFSGMSNKRHANDLEFLYRTIVDRYGFDKKNIYVLNYDGTLNSQDGALTSWPGDGTAFRMKVTDQGNKAGFEAAINDLKGKLKAHDLLLIHTNNHGGNSGPGQSYLCTYPSWGQYFASDFGNKLAELPIYRSLIVMMEQCNSGGFNNFVITKSTANATSIASAVDETHSSWGTADGNWDCFAHDWIAAQAGHQPTGAALASNPDTNSDGKIEAKEAFNYALSIHYSGDVPTYNENTAAGGNVSLGQQYIVWWWWCFVLVKILEPHYLHLPPEEYNRIVNEIIGPKFKEIIALADSESDALRKKIEPKLKEIVESGFKK